MNKRKNSLLAYIWSSVRAPAPAPRPHDMTVVMPREQWQEHQAQTAYLMAENVRLKDQLHDLMDHASKINPGGN